MAPATRSSKRVEVAEDRTAVTSPLISLTPTQQWPMHDLPTTTNTMPTLEDVAVDYEMKALKAAYKLATGGMKKLKKSKSRKKVDQSTTEEFGSSATPAISTATSATTPSSSSPPWEIPTDLKLHAANKIAPIVKVTEVQSSEEAARQVCSSLALT